MSEEVTLKTLDDRLFKLNLVLDDIKKKEKLNFSILYALMKKHDIDLREVVNNDDYKSDTSGGRD